ncbi:MAG TPA: hypothetical protein VLT36_12785 [Candidatus Dormibacteraeota bacterium]|nr:hypothetical protein [Candidatus Dormibacteraeota bacterium]
MSLSTLAIVLGLGMGLPQIYGLMNPKAFASSVRKFPRSLPWGFFLMLAGTAWFLYNLSLESVSDFASYKTPLMLIFAAIGVGSCIFVQDLLAIRGLAVVLLLIAKLMVDTGRPHLGSPWVLIFQGWAYLLVIGGIWFTVSPWRLRDFLDWATANEKRIKLGCGIRLAFGIFIAILGFTKF